SLGACERNPGDAARGVSGASPVYRLGRDRSRQGALRGRADARARARRARHVLGRRARARHGPRWRADRAPLHRLELRIVLEGTDRAGESRLECGPDEAAAPRRPGMDPLAARAGTAESDVIIPPIRVATALVRSSKRFSRKTKYPG